MKSKRALHILSIVLFVGLLASLGLGSMTSFRLPEAGASADILDGTYRTEIEDLFDRSVPLRPASVSFWATVEYALFGTGLEGVLVRNGYLFTTEEWYQKPIYPDAWQSIERAAAALEALDIQLLVLPIPAKSRVLPHQLPKPMPEANSARYSRVLAELSRRGIASVDLLSSFGQAENPESLFMRTDTHWSPAGARIAAEEIATELRAAFPALASDFPVGEYRNRPEAVEDEFRGDLFEFLPTRSWLRQVPAPERLQRFELEVLREPEFGLFDTPSIAVALVGTSYSAGRDWNFEGFLKEYLRTDIVNLSEEGQGPFEPMEAALEAGYLTEFGVRLVIWEIPERYLPVEIPDL